MRWAYRLLLLAAPSLTGCAMCCSPFDCEYPHYGGAWERVDRCYGRVGSAFTPEVGVKVGEGGATPYYSPQQPTPAARPMTEDLPEPMPTPEMAPAEPMPLQPAPGELMPPQNTQPADPTTLRQPAGGYRPTYTQSYGRSLVQPQQRPRTSYPVRPVQPYLQ